MATLGRDPHGVSTVQYLIFRQGIALAGGAEHLALILGVPSTEVWRWAAGNELSPTSVFNSVVELINAEKKKPRA